MGRKNSLNQVARKYGFGFRKTDNTETLTAKNTDGKWTGWIKHSIANEEVEVKGDTDNLNLWLHETRPDLSPEKIVAFVKDLNECLCVEPPIALSDIIDPEDWQEIADVEDAHTDSRYTTTCAITKPPLRVNFGNIYIN